MVGGGAGGRPRARLCWWLASSRTLGDGGGHHLEQHVLANHRSALTLPPPRASLSRQSRACAWRAGSGSGPLLRSAAAARCGVSLAVAEAPGGARGPARGAGGGTGAVVGP